ncbi:MAG: hypothetical protein JWO06_1714 [Bacteroidota bacterium]|nr:hypothetical protein [Bacteroidota bacterium]
MTFNKTNEMLLNGLYYEWLNSLCAYHQQLEGLESAVDAITRGADRGIIDYELKANLQEIKAKLYAEKCEVDHLSDLIVAKREKVAQSEPTEIIAFSEVLENNHLRDRVRKAEQIAFYLKYQVNQLLSKAS